MKMALTLSNSSNPAKLLLRNFEDQDSESQFSVFYLAYNLYTLGDAGINDSHLNSTVYEVTYTDNLVKFFLQGVLLSIICIMGIGGNICSASVLMHKRMKSSISCFLIGLAICDSLILLASFVMLGLPTCLSLELFYPGTTSVYLWMSCIAPPLYGVSITALTGSVCFTLAVTFERYLVVCHPFMSRRVCTWHRACQASVLIYVIIIIYNLPRWFEYRCESVFDDAGNKIGCNVKATDFRRNPNFCYYYIFLSYGVTHFFFAIGFLIVFNLLIYFKIRQANHARRILSSTEETENSLTYMLFVVVAVFLACNVLFAVAIVWKLVYWKTPLAPYPIGGAVGVFLITLNSSLNFMIYCIYGEKFRETFIHMLRQPWRRLSRHRSDSDFSRGSKSSGVSSRNVKTQVVKTICDTV